MSAIVGIYQVNGSPVDPALLRSMTDVLAHRGPDGQGEWVTGPIGLGHRLLYTTPESLNEKQPVTDGQGVCQLVWDGWLDNREELISALKAEAWPLGGQTDPELILEAYRQWGTDCLKRIVGEFAWALWDARTRTLVCARDPIGVKPFYYYWNGDRFLFGSEIRALFANASIVKRPNEAMIADYLLMGFRDPEATFFDGIKQLRPGHFLCVRDGNLHTERYWDVDPTRQVQYRRDEDYLDEFRDVFREAVRCRLRSYAPVGVLLSGGIDSTSVTAMAETLRREEGGAPGLAAFAWLAEGFLQEEWDAIQRLVGTYKTEIHPVRPEGSDGPLTLFELFLECAETPHHDPAPTIAALLEPARARGCRVVLTGFGADELSQYGEDGFLADLLRTFQLRRLVRDVRRRADSYGGGDWRGTILLLLRAQLPLGVRRLIRRLSNRQVPRWFEAGFAERVKLRGWMMPEERRGFPTLSQEETYRALTRPTMPLGLNQIDAMASTFSLEPRHPYLDRRVIEFFLAIPSAVKMRAGYRKRFVQHALAETIPGPIRAQEGSDYFVPPMDQQVCRGLEARRMDHDLFRPHAHIFQYVKRSEAEGMKRRYLRDQAPYRNLLWSFVRLELWLRHWFPVPSTSEGGTR